MKTSQYSAPHHEDNAGGVIHRTRQRMKSNKAGKNILTEADSN